MKKPWRTAAGIARLLLALVLLAVPAVRGGLAERREERSAEAFRERAAVQRVWEQETGQEPFPELRQAAEEYNRQLLRERRAGPGEEEMAESPLDLTGYGLPEGVFGLVEIPGCGIRLPLYLGASEENLTRGACVLGGTSLPLGGEGTHCAVAGHRGWYAADFFRHLDRISEGDEVLIQNPWETLCYRVREVKVISAGDSGELRIRPEEDLLTLLTCRPWAGGWTTRLTVVCERAEEEREETGTCTTTEERQRG